MSVRASAPNVDEVAAFAAQRTSDRALTIMLVNKQLDSSASVSLDVANFNATTIERWQLTGSGIQRVADLNGTTLTLPLQSVTLLVAHTKSGKRRAVR